jgi:hypothetical protein
VVVPIKLDVPTELEAPFEVSVPIKLDGPIKLDAPIEVNVPIELEATSKQGIDLAEIHEGGEDKLVLTGLQGGNSVTFEKVSLEECLPEPLCKFQGASEGQ